jgi:hypothetical protein
MKICPKKKEIFDCDNFYCTYENSSKDFEHKPPYYYDSFAGYDYIKCKDCLECEIITDYCKIVEIDEIEDEYARSEYYENNI